MATWQHLRSSTANKRPTTSLADGRIAINTNTASPGLFFKDSAGTGIVKVGPVHVGTTAPNSTPAVGGSSGNYTGEQWLDTSVSPAQLKVWNGSAWVGVVADELPVSKLQDGDAGQIVQTDAAGTGVEWSSTANLPLGSAAAPAYRFQGDANTGIYSPGADQVAISTGGTGRLFVDASGDVSLTGNIKFSRTNLAEITADTGGNINISADANNTSAASNINFSVDGLEAADVNNSGYLRFNKTNFSGAGVCTQSTDSALNIGGGSNTINNGINVALSGPDRVSNIGYQMRWNTTSLYLWDKTSDYHAWNTGGSERLRVTSAGFVGIGTSAPGEILDAYGNIRFGSPNIGRIYSTDSSRGSIQISAPNDATNRSVSYGNNYYLDSSGTWTQASAAVGGSAIEMRANSNNYGEFVFRQKQDPDLGGAERIPLVITNAGIIGIGITTPTATTHIYEADTAAAASRMLELSTASGGNFQVTVSSKASATPDWQINTGGSEPIFFSQGAAERVRIDSSGRLLVGTSSSLAAGYQLQVAGTTDPTSSLSLHRYQASTNGSIVELSKSRGASVGTDAIVSSGDILGTVAAKGYDGAGYTTAARINFQVDGTPGTNDMPGRIVLSTTPDGSAAPVERMRITSAGNVGIGTTSPDTKLNVVQSSTGRAWSATAGVGDLIVERNGNVGLALIAGNTSASSLNFGDIDDENAGFITYYHDVDALAFRTGGTGEDVRIDSSGRLLVGTSTGTPVGSVGNTNFVVEGAGAPQASAAITRTDATELPAQFIFGKSRSNTILVSNDVVGRIEAAGHDGTDVRTPLGRIEFAVDGTPGLNDMPGRIVLSTTLDGASSPTERLRITNDGVMCYDQAAPVSYAAAATLVVGDLKNGLIQYTGAAATLTLPTGTLTEGGFSGVYTNMTFEWSVINTGSGTCTIGAGTAHTIVGGATIAAGASGRFASRRTAANTFVSYRLS